MKLGFFTMPMHPPGRNYTQTLKEDREAVLPADKPAKKRKGKTA